MVNKKTNTDIKRLVIQECANYRHIGKCIWDRGCYYFEEDESKQQCEYFDKLIPYYMESKQKYNEHRLKRKYKKSFD